MLACCCSDALASKAALKGVHNLSHHGSLKCSVLIHKKQGWVIDALCVIYSDQNFMWRDAFFISSSDSRGIGWVTMFFGGLSHRILSRVAIPSSLSTTIPLENLWVLMLLYLISMKEYMGS
jgi:hypothetical protein